MIFLFVLFLQLSSLLGETATPQRIEAICIDLDGTLIDSCPSLFRAYCKFLLTLGREGSDEEFQSLNGIPVFEMLPILKQRHGLVLPVDDLQRIYKCFIEEEYLDSPLMTGALDFLRWAQGNNIPLALVTSSRQEWVGPILTKLGVDIYFDVVITRDRVERGKPHPDPYLAAIKELGALAANSYAIEDAELGLQSARSAGLTALIYTPFPPFSPIGGNWSQLQTIFQKNLH